MKILAVEFSSAQRSAAVGGRANRRADAGRRPVLLGSAMEPPEPGGQGGGAGEQPPFPARASGWWSRRWRRRIAGGRKSARWRWGWGRDPTRGFAGRSRWRRAGNWGGASALLGVSSVECLAAQAEAEGRRGAVNIIVDAQRNEFYLARYEIRRSTAGGKRRRCGWRRLRRSRRWPRRGGTLLGPEIARWFAGGTDMYPEAAMLGPAGLRAHAILFRARNWSRFTCGRPLSKRPRRRGSFHSRRHPSSFIPESDQQVTAQKAPPPGWWRRPAGGRCKFDVSSLGGFRQICRGDGLKIVTCMKKKSIGIIFLTVLIDLVGFGLILPLIPLYAQSFGASGMINGVIMASYSLMQFLFAPVWGRLSDRIGRRPVLLTSTACACLSYVIFALGSGVKDNHTLALAIILVSRIFAGICGANITVAQAYIADITPPEQRSAQMGLVGMAFGLGFILGPVLGALSALYYRGDGAGLDGGGAVRASILSGRSCGWRKAGSPARITPRNARTWTNGCTRCGTPRLNLLIGIFFLATFCFTCFETTIGYLVQRNFKIESGHDRTAENCGRSGQGGLADRVLRLDRSVVQGGLLRRLVKADGRAEIDRRQFVRGGVGHRGAALLDNLGMAAARGWRSFRLAPA